jgi:hypothetical protein
VAASTKIMQQMNIQQSYLWNHPCNHKIFSAMACRTTEKAVRRPPKESCQRISTFFVAGTGRCQGHNPLNSRT